MNILTFKFKLIFKRSCIRLRNRKINDKIKSLLLQEKMASASPVTVSVEEKDLMARNTKKVKIDGKGSPTNPEDTEMASAVEVNSGNSTGLATKQMTYRDKVLSISSQEPSKYLNLNP